MNQIMTNELLKIKVAGEAHNMKERMREKCIYDNAAWIKVLEELNIPHYVG